MNETVYSIEQIERAVNYWRGVEGPHDGVSLGETASRLANVYGNMIFTHEAVVAARDLDQALIGKIELAIKQQSLPLL
ncbi:hypothetical protein ECGR_2525 [Escherichia coli]|uniref:DUF3717 domain-containing protein n=1 Tax=Enterobacteriaceae TaxID=543 RepID=UPI000C1C4B10|nr:MULTISPECIES: DUF3717 domain-containing protein [Enterobacteriaceae]GJJ30462.1 hypothetical protein ECGR_2525 [Escherichia coli]